MKISDEIKAQLPPWNSLEGIEDARKMAQVKLTDLGLRTLYLLEAQYSKESGWAYLGVLHSRLPGRGPFDAWEFGVWSESDIEDARPEFRLDPYFTPTLLGGLTFHFWEK